MDAHNSPKMYRIARIQVVPLSVQALIVKLVIIKHIAQQIHIVTTTLIASKQQNKPALMMYISALNH